MKLGKLRSPARRRAAVEEVRRALPEVGERRACRVLGQPREVHCCTARVRDDEAPLTGRIVELALVYGRYGVPDHVRSDNGSEFTAKAVRAWLGKVGVKTLYIEPGSPWENGYVESLNGKLRDELLNGEIFYTVAEARVLIERWREHYNQVRPHSALGYRPPAPEAIAAGPPSASLRAVQQRFPAQMTTA